jgi:hypothetical protein
MRLLNSLKGKAFNYTRDPGDDAQVGRFCAKLIETFYQPHYICTVLGEKQSLYDQQHVLSPSAAWTIR